MWSTVFSALTSLLRAFGIRISNAFASVFSSVYAAFLFWLPQIVVNGLIALGVGTVTYVLGDFALETIYSQIESQLSGLSGNILILLKQSGIGEAMKIIFGALSARLTYSSIGATKKTMTWNA